jgi:hypothetical protein
MTRSFTLDACLTAKHDHLKRRAVDAKRTMRVDTQLLPRQYSRLDSVALAMVSG